MVLPISCNECRRRKIRCDRVQPCKNCSSRSITCTYPEKFRSIEINKMKANSNEVSNDIEFYQNRIKELEMKLATSEDLISIFDTTGNSCTKYFGPNSITSLEGEMMYGIFPSKQEVTKIVNLKKKDLPALIDGDEVKNRKVVKSLVEFFFKEDQYYYFNEMLNKTEMLRFLDNYDHMNSWNNDEDIMLLCCVLVDVLKNCLEDPVIPHQKSKLICLLNYYFQLSKMQTTETIKLVQSQMILLNYYYFEFHFEKCWKLIFQIVSNAYSLGLHIKGGILWTKINTMEALLCSASSRPNLIHNNDLLTFRMMKEDELQEYKLCNVLREKNKMCIISYVSGIKIEYDKILELDAMYDEYTSSLESKLVNNPGLNVDALKRNEKIHILLLMCYTTQIKIHYESFEKQTYSEKKIYILLEKNIRILENYVYGKLDSLRTKFSALECFFYQFLLIFLKYLNFKSVNLAMGINSGSTEELRKEEICKLSTLQERLKKVFGKNYFQNMRINKVVSIIFSINLAEMKSESLIMGNIDQNNRSRLPSPGSNCQNNGNTNGSSNTYQGFMSPGISSDSTSSISPTNGNGSIQTNGANGTNGVSGVNGLNLTRNYYVTPELKGFVEDSNNYYDVLRSITDNPL